MTDLINVAWNEFQTSAVNTFKGLEGDTHFTDVTLACGDGGSVKVHKVVLSMCSQLFRDIIIQNPHPHPLIYLADCDLEDLKSLLQFIYRGEVLLEQGKLEKFMGTAKRFKVKGLGEKGCDREIKSANIDGKEVKSVQHETIPDRMDQEESTTIEQSERVDTNGKNLVHSKSVELEADKKSETATKEVFYEKVIVTPEIKQESPEETYLENKSHDAKISSCKRSRSTHTCSICGVQRSSKNNLEMHMKTKHHFGEKLQCDQCKYDTAYKDVLDKHILIKHTDFRYPCNQCDYKATQKGTLKAHRENKHEGKTFTCEKCGNIFTLKSSYRCHMEVKHGERRYKCDSCDYVAGQMPHLKSHKKSKHSYAVKSFIE